MAWFRIMAPKTPKGITITSKVSKVRIKAERVARGRNFLVFDELDREPRRKSEPREWV